MGRTILELFEGSDFDKAVDSKANESRGTVFAQIKSFGEQELTGVRVKSAVELNNPLIYGNEATRIALRSTPGKDKQLDSRESTEGGGGGLIGKGLAKITGGNVTSLSGLRDKVNEKLGIPITQIPSRYYTQLGNVEAINDPEKGYIQTLADIKAGGAGKGIGKFLSGGNPKTIAKQAAGKALKEAKKEIRGKLFGKSSEPTPNPLKQEEVTKYDRDKSSYSHNEENQKLIAQSGTDEVEFGILKKYRNGGEFNAAKIRVGKSYIKGSDDGTNPKSYTKNSDGTYTEETLNEDIINDRIDRIIIGDKKNKLISNKGFTNKDDIINQSGIYTDEEKKIGETPLDDYDFVPLKFKSVVTDETVNFRGTITGLSETVSPSWNSAKFSGNPFSFYTYDGVERSVSFNFTIYPMNSKELLNNWSKIGFLTSLTYPLGNPDIKSAYQSSVGSVRAPLLYFTLGDLYIKKESFIESLQYTVPDASTWQLDGTTEQIKKYESSGEYFDKLEVKPIKVDKGYKLPHMVEVAVTMKFLEQRRTSEKRENLYGFTPITYTQNGN